MGYPYGKKAWKLYDLDTNECFESRDVVFREDIFLFQEESDRNPTEAKNRSYPLAKDFSSGFVEFFAESNQNEEGPTEIVPAQFEARGAITAMLAQDLAWEIAAALAQAQHERSWSRSGPRAQRECW